MRTHPRQACRSPVDRVALLGMALAGTAAPTARTDAPFAALIAASRTRAGTAIAPQVGAHACTCGQAGGFFIGGRTIPPRLSA